MWVTKPLTNENVCACVCVCLLARVCVHKILCLEDPVLREAFMYSHRLTPGHLLVEPGLSEPGQDHSPLSLDQC